MIERYLEFMINVRGCSVNTAETYRSSLSCFAQFCRIRKQNPSWSSIDVDDIVSYVYYMRSRGLSSRSVNVFLAASVSFFDYLCRFHGLAKNPAVMVDKVKEPKRLPKVIEQSVFDEFFSFFSRPSDMAFMKHSFYVSICLMYYAGLRASEVLTLSWMNIKDRHMRIIGKGNKHNDVYLNINAQLSLDAYLCERDDNNDYLFVASRYPYNKLSIKSVENIFNRLSNKTNLTVTPHIMRHTYATLALQSGMPLTHVQKTLNHSSSDTTLIYAEILKEDIQKSHLKYVL